MPHPPGLIGILSGDLTRWAVFSQSLLALERPPGTDMAWVTGQWIAVAVNQFIQAMEPQHAWCCILADDHPYPPDMLLRLLDHQLPLVTPLVALRQRPYNPSLFHETATGFVGYTWGELTGKQGLLAVDTFGGAGAVVRREVIEAVGHPFYENMPGKREAPHEDLYAFSKCRQAGFQPMVDLECRVGHCLGTVMVPTRTPEGRYGVEFWASNEPLGTLFPTDPLPTDVATYHAYT